MRIFKKYVDEDEWFEVDKSDVIKHCEKRGYWEKGTSLQILKDIGSIHTPWAIWKL